MLKGLITASSQPEALAFRLREAGVEHGVTARIPVLEPVQAVTLLYDQADTRFCNVKPILARNVRTIQAGDGTPIPLNIGVVVSGLEFPRDGLFTIENALVSVNGSITVTADAETRVREYAVARA